MGAAAPQSRSFHRRRRKERYFSVLLGLALILNVLLWFYARDVRERWPVVPPAPSETAFVGSTLGDRQFAYRMLGLMLQNMGDTGGRTSSFEEYDYEELKKWLFLAESLDSRSDHVPLLAAYYYAIVKDAERLRHLVDYLEVAGDKTYGEKWRWLGQAVFIARFKMEDLDRGLELAEKLAALDNPDMAEWARQMPAFVRLERGEKEAAYAYIIQLMKDRSEALDPAEVLFMREFICTRVLDAEEAKLHPLCEGLPEL